jgi:hypothetical protein
VSARVTESGIETNSRPGVRATIHLAKVGIKIFRTPRGKGGRELMSIHAFGEIEVRKYATDFGIA